MSIPLSIIVVTYNGWHHLEPCLRSMLPQLHGLDEIVIVDNGSSDGTEEGVAEIGDSRIRYERLEENLGFAGANNIGAERATREWLLLLNNDTIVLDGFLDSLRRAALHQQPIPDIRVQDDSRFGSQNRQCGDSSNRPPVEAGSARPGF